MNGCIYLRADSLEFVVNLSVCESQHGHADRFDGGSAGFVVGVAFGGEVLGTVELDGKLRLVTIEINNELTYCLLTLKTYRVGSQELVPQFIFLWGRVFP